MTPGRLSATWPACLSQVWQLNCSLYTSLPDTIAELYRALETLQTPYLQVPPITDYTMEGRTYRYYKGEPLYPFGYGLSYSQFLYKDIINEEAIHQGDLAGIAVTVENLGPYEAQEVSIRARV